MGTTPRTIHLLTGTNRTTANRIPVVMCIDAEPEERMMALGERPDWRGFERSHEYFNSLRLRLEEVTSEPAHFSWFFRMDPQIEQIYGTPNWSAERYRELIDQLRRAGDSLGLHVHTWRLDSTTNKWVSEFADQKWVEHCVRTAFEAFHESFGERCRYFRFGDHWMNNATVSLIDRLGAQVDLTIEPGQSGPTLPDPFTGSFVDYSNVPQHPYRPSRSDFTGRGTFLKRRIWMVPLSAGKSGSPQVAPNPDAASTSEEKDRSNTYFTLNLYDDSPTLCSIADRLLERENPHLVMVVRSDVVLYPTFHANLQRTFDHLLDHPLARQFVFCSPRKLVELLK